MRPILPNPLIAIRVLLISSPPNICYTVSIYFIISITHLTNYVLVIVNKLLKIIFPKRNMSIRGKRCCFGYKDAVKGKDVVSKVNMWLQIKNKKQLLKGNCFYSKISNFSKCSD